MRILVMNGPNLNRLGKRRPSIYGDLSLNDVAERLSSRAADLGVELTFVQNNSEGALIDALQAMESECDGVIINPGALSHYGLSLREALAEIELPVIEVHISNIYSREEWRHNDVIAPVVTGQVAGFGWRGYLAALELLASYKPNPLL